MADESKKVLDELTVEAQKLGLYEDEKPKPSRKKKKKSAKKSESVKKIKRVRPARNTVEMVSTVKFTAWFTNKIENDKRLKPHHYDQVLAYMKGAGLKEREPASKYEWVLKQYFGET